MQQSFGAIQNDMAILVMCTLCEKLGDPYKIEMKILPFKVVFHCLGCDSRSDDEIHEYTDEFDKK